MKSLGTLYLLPNRLGKDSYFHEVLPANISDIIANLHGVFAENAKRARDYLSHFDKKRNWNTFPVVVLEKHNRGGARNDKKALFSPLLQGENWGILSDCGCPCVADPGSDMVLVAHSLNIPVKPLVGPSSLLLALMASGLRGQQFVFHGYVPKSPEDRRKFLQKIEFQSKKEHQTQIFMEAPFRNKALFHDFFSELQKQTLLGIASNLTLKYEKIQTKTIAQWEKTEMSEYEKSPAIFTIFAP